MKKITMNGNVQQTNDLKQGVTREEFDYRMDFLQLRTEQIERKLMKKADEVVSIQVLQHRSELEEIYQTLASIDENIQFIDRELSKFTEKVSNIEDIRTSVKKKQKSKQNSQVATIYSI